MQDLEPEVVQETVEQVELLKGKLKEAHNRQKCYADKRRKDLEFEVGDAVYLKMKIFRGVTRIVNSKSINRGTWDHTGTLKG